MKIAIISDVHDNLAGLKKALDCCAEKGIASIICCGDLASLETLDFLNDHFEGAIFYVLGNAEAGKLFEFEDGYTYKKTKMFRTVGEASFGGIEVAFTHYPEQADDLCFSGKYKLVFHGHTHKPWEETVGQCKKLNPGNMAGILYPPTFAIWETDNNDFKLIRVHDLE
jgi:putative phosphoesterase